MTTTPAAFSAGPAIDRLLKTKYLPYRWRVWFFAAFIRDTRWDNGQWNPCSDNPADWSLPL